MYAFERGTVYQQGISACIEAWTEFRTYQQPDPDLLDREEERLGDLQEHESKSHRDEDLAGGAPEQDDQYCYENCL